MPRLHYRSLLATLAALTSVRNAGAESCEEVWFVEGSFVGETFTCGERIVYLQTPQGGGKTEREARIQASLEELKCADCWPWEKYRQEGETDRSEKRGIAIENSRLTPETISGLSQIISWGVTWDYQLTDGPDLSLWKMAGVDFVPLIWGAGSIPLAQADGIPEGSKALLGFNEPNFPNQANLDPHTAALHWKDIEKLAEENNISTIVSPSMNYHESMDPIEWLEQFLAHCSGCKVDAIGIHVFTCYAAGLKYHLDRYRALGKPMWITEIACSDWQSPERLSAEGQMAYMREAIPLLEADEDVVRYAWFSYFKDEWDHPIVDGENGDAGLVHPNGTLTPLGQLYNTFAAGNNLTEINITEPLNETTSTQTSSTETSSAIPVSQTVTTTPTVFQSATTTVSLTESTGATSTTTSSSGTSTSTTTATRSSSKSSASASSLTKTSETSTATPTATTSSTAESKSVAATATQSTSVSATSTSQQSEIVEIRSTTAGLPPSTTKSSTSTRTASSTTEFTALAQKGTSTSTITLTASAIPTSTSSFISTEAEYDDEGQDNSTNETDNQPEERSCTEAMDVWCQSDPSSAPFLPLQHCADWRLHDAVCSSPSGANNAPQFAGATELEKGTFPALFLLLAVLGAAMAGAALASLFHRQKCHYLPCCGCKRRREDQDQEALKHALSEKPEWTGNFLPVICNGSATARVAPQPGVLLPMEAVARRVASSPHASERIYEGSPVIGTLSRKAVGQEIAIGTPVGTTPASRAAALTTLTEAMAKATSQNLSLDEREIALHQAGRVLTSKAALNFPLALRQEAETWHSRQEERLNLAKSMEAVVDRAVLLEEAAGSEADTADPLRALLSRAMVADKAELEALLREAARRASAFQDKLDRQRLTVKREPRSSNQSLLTAAELIRGTDDLAELRAKATQELAAVQALQDAAGAEDWKIACESLESKWKQFVADCDPAVEETQAALAANRTAKILTSDTEREAALAEAARRQAMFQEELQKQRQKLQKRTKAKSAAPTPLELGRLLEDEATLQALEMDRDAAMKECEQFVDAAAPLCGEAGEWRDLLEGWQNFNEDLIELARHNQDLREAMPKESAWSSLGSQPKLGKVDVSLGEQAAMLAEAARCAAVFDEELQKQRQQMKKRRKTLQKQGGSEQATSLLDVCHALADKEVLKGLSHKQAEAHAKCEAMASFGELSEAWAELGATWAQMEKDINKAEKEVSEAAKAVTTEANSQLVQALGTAQVRDVARDVDDADASRRQALQEATRRVAIFDEELSKQRAAMMRRRAANPSGAHALGCALLDDMALKSLAAECTSAEAECQAAAEKACKENGEAEQWQELLKLWGKLHHDLREDMEQAAAEARACRAQEASEALAAAGLPAAVRQALKFEHNLAVLSREGGQGAAGGPSELRHAQKLATVTRLRAEQAEGLQLCESKLGAIGHEEMPPRIMECRTAWQELVDLWKALGKDLELSAQELEGSAEPKFWRKVLDTTVSEAERQSALAKAARCAAQFDQDFQQQRERLLHRKKAALENAGDRLLALGNAVELQALAAEKENAKSACLIALKDAEASRNSEEAQGWKQVIEVYTTLDDELDAARKEVDAFGSFSGEPDVDVGRHMVHKVIRDQKKSAVKCLNAVEHALNMDRGPLEELMEAQQIPCSVKSSGGSTTRSRHAQAARVQMWDVLDEAQGLLDSLKGTGTGSKTNAESLKRLGDEASKQLEEILETCSPQQEKPTTKDFGCQTVFRLGGMAWHANPAVQRLLEDLTKVNSQGELTSDRDHLDRLDAEVKEIVNWWRQEFIANRREASLARSRSRSQGRSGAESSYPVSASEPKAEATTPPADPPCVEKVETHVDPPSKCSEGDMAQSFQASETPPVDSSRKVPDEEDTAVRKPPSGRRNSSPGRLPSSRLAYSQSRSFLPGSTNSDIEEKPSVPARRRRSLSREKQDEAGSASMGPALAQSASPSKSEAKQEIYQAHQAPQPEAVHNDLLAQLEMKVSGSQPLTQFFSELHDSKNAGHSSPPLSRRGGPGDGSLLAPPPSSPGDLSRSLSPASSAGSSQSPGHIPRRLDPIVRPHAPPLPSAGRLLLASQESPADSARSSPRYGC